MAGEYGLRQYVIYSVMEILNSTTKYPSEPAGKDVNAIRHLETSQVNYSTTESEILALLMKIDMKYPPKILRHDGPVKVWIYPSLCSDWFMTKILATDQRSSIPGDEIQSAVYGRISSVCII